MFVFLARVMTVRKRTQQKASRLAQFLVIGGVILLALVVLTLKDQPQTQTTVSNSALPEAQLERALSAGMPTLAFFHSNNCEQCLIMIKTVDQVLPEFAGAVTLVDVNVYDPNNEPLLRKVRLQYIPTLVFFDRSGQGQIHVGVMEPDVLRQQLSKLVGEQ